MENNTGVQETALKAESVSKAGATIMAISGAAPAMCVGGSIGALMMQTGNGIALAAAIATIAVVFIGLSYGSLSEKYNNCGGTYAYITQAIGRKSGLWTAFVYFGVLITTSGCPPTIFCNYFNALTGIPNWIGFFVFAIPLVLITYFGVELSTRALVIVWLIQMTLLVIPAIMVISNAGGLNLGTSLSNAFVPTGGFIEGNTVITGLMLAVLTWVWAYVGFEAPAYMGEELKGGAKSVKFAIPVSALAVGVIYVIACWLWTATMTPDQLGALQGSDIALENYVTMMNVAGGTVWVSLAIIASCYACGLAFYSLMPRFLYDLGRTNTLPKGLGKLNKYQIPFRAVIVYGCVAFCMCMYGSYGAIEGTVFAGLSDLFVVMACNASTAYGFICIGNIKERWKDNSAGGIFFGKIIPIITVALLTYMIFFTTGWKYVILTLAWYVVAFIFAFARGAAMDKKDAAAKQ